MCVGGGGKWAGQFLVNPSFLRRPPTLPNFYFEVDPANGPSPLLSQQIITLEIPNGFQNVIEHKINKKDETIILLNQEKKKKKRKKNRWSIFKDSKISYELSETYMR